MTTRAAAAAAAAVEVRTDAAAADSDLPSAVPHAGYHFDGSPRRFFEGWYWKVTDPETGDSFALIYSVEDPGAAAGAGGLPHGGPTSGLTAEQQAPHQGVGVQVMGPDGYCCQFTRDTRSFWADAHRLELGATLRSRLSAVPTRMTSKEEFERCVEHGFQASAMLQQGSIVAQEEDAGGEALSTVASCSWCLSIRPMSGWGTSSPAGPPAAVQSCGVSPAGAGGVPQRATAGWLSVLQVFEPHWQVLMSHGLATGWVQWGARRYEFRDAPSYAEKNWGGGFPSKWHWIQCNTWTGVPGLSITAVGARRALLLGAPGLGLGEEDVGLIGITLPAGLLQPSSLPAMAHQRQDFVEIVPWNGELEWDVQPWGAWRIRGFNDEHEVLVEAECDAADKGVVLRAPTIQQGLTPFCKDSFAGTARLRVWRRRRGSPKAGPALPLPLPSLPLPPALSALALGAGTSSTTHSDRQGASGGGWLLGSASRPGALLAAPLPNNAYLVLDVASTSAAVEVGGGPWWSSWSAQAAMKEPFRTLVQLPIDIGSLSARLPTFLKPPGL